MDPGSVLSVHKHFLDFPSISWLVSPIMKSKSLAGSGTVMKKSGWRVSKYKAAGDRYFTLKVRKAR